VFENKVLRRIFRHKRETMAGDWSKLHNLYSSPYIIRVIKSTRLRWVGNKID